MFSIVTVVGSLRHWIWSSEVIIFCLVGIFSSSLQTSLLLLIILSSLDVMVGDIADNLCVGLEAECLGIVGHLRKFSFRSLELCVILNIGLNLAVLRQPLVLRGVCHHSRLGLGHVSRAVGELVEALVVLHGELHVADLTSEAVLVPHLLQTLELLHRVDDLITLGAALRHDDDHSLVAEYEALS